MIVYTIWIVRSQKPYYKGILIPLFANVLLIFSESYSALLLFIPKNILKQSFDSLDLNVYSIIKAEIRILIIYWYGQKRLFPTFVFKIFLAIFIQHLADQTFLNNFFTEKQHFTNSHFSIPNSCWNLNNTGGSLTVLRYVTDER